ncbi:MAG TPA: OmpA family protein [Burkholderiales bacterium]|jgi:chemotaxis protein MotB|nr:OmpA family protein [Burkholderiales bacterium]
MTMMKMFRIAGAVLAGTLVAAGCVSKGEHEKMQAEKDQQIAALATERGALAKERDSLQQQIREMQSQRTALEKQQALLRDEIVTLEKQRVQLEAASRQDKSQYDGLVRNLTEEVKKGELQVRQYKNMLTVEVAEQLFFDSGRATLKESGKAVLKKVGEALKGYDDKLIRVIGHTDNVPIAKALQAQFPSNWELSAARATTVVRYLESVGVPPERLVASGRAEHSPVALNDDAEGRRKNRRIEITLIDKGLAQELQEQR